MIYLIWSIINIGIILYFFYLVLGLLRNGVRSFNPPFKILSIIIIIAGVVQIISGYSSKSDDNRIILNTQYDKTYNSDSKSVILEENMTFDIQMDVKYSISQKEYIPIESNSFLTGFVNAYVWEFNSLQTENYIPNQKTEFFAKGTLKWKLFGLNVYSQAKTFRGKIE